MKTFAIFALAATAFAKTDLAGCTSSVVGASLLWYVPSNGEICSILDCGGGRAPPKTTVPGCAAYAGTASYTPSFIPNYGQATATPSVKTTAGYSAVSSASLSLASPTASTGSSASQVYSTALTSPITSTGSSPSQAQPTTLTSAPSLSSPPAVGTGGAVGGGNATVTPGHNGTTSGKPSATSPPINNGAGLNSVAQGVTAVAVGMFGMLML